MIRVKKGHTGQRKPGSLNIESLIALSERRRIKMAGKTVKDISLLRKAL
jgi:hypothetical protein